MNEIRIFVNDYSKTYRQQSLLTMKYSIYIIYLTLFLLSCGNFSHNSPVTDYSDSIMDSPNTYESITAPVSNTVPQTYAKETNYVPANTHDSSKNKPYDDGYEQGYADGEEDGYSHSGYQASFDSSNEYSGKASDDYEEGYEESEFSINL